MILQISKKIPHWMKKNQCWEKLREKYYSFIVDKNRLKEYKKTDYSKRMGQMRNIFKGKRCFIIGNGPSLTADDLDLLKDEYTFASNYIYKIFSHTDWRPTFYCVSDQGFLKNGLEQPEMFQLKAKMHFFQWNPVYKCVDDYEHIILPEPYCQYCLLHHIEKIRFSSKCHKKIYDANTVTYIMIQIAIFMGFKKIYLLGVDHSFSHSSKNGHVKICDINNHFYSQKKADSSELFMTADIASMEKGYRMAKKFANTHGVKIFNATRGGNLEVFKRCSLDFMKKD